MYLSRVKIYNNIINNNKARYAGGLSSDTCSSEIYNNIINSNHAERNYGGMWFFPEGNSMKIINNTLINNNKEAIMFEAYYGSSIIFINNIISGENTELGVYGAGENNRVAILSNNCFYGIQNKHYYRVEAATRIYITNEAGLNSISDFACGGNIVADPQMKADNMHLQPASPCINAGIDPTSYINSLTNDFDGDRRPIFGQYDIGADEATNITPKIILIYPENDSSINNIKPVFKWEIPGEENNKILHFKIEIATDLEFSNILYSFESKTNSLGFNPVPPVQQGTGNQYYQIFQKLNYNTPYFWRVSAWNGLEYYIGSPTWRFVIYQP